MRLIPALLLAAALPGAPDPVEPAARPFDRGQVRLLDGPFREAMLRNQKYLRSLDEGRLLHTFRINAGFPSEAKPLGGWEAPGCELRGHCLGHYLTACALMWAHEGDEVLRKKGDTLVAELARVQEGLAAKGATPGYLSAYPESFIDRVEKAQRVWAPYYTLHKILAGLLDMHLLCGNAQALEILKKKAAWQKARLDRLSEEQVQKSLGNEFGGMNEIWANLYAVTKDPGHLRLARAFDHKFVFDPLARKEDKLNGLHANTQIPKMIGAAREYELTGEERYRTIARFFWERVALHRSYAIGGHSDHEHFFPVEQFSKHLSPGTAETCNTYNMLKLTRHVFGWEPSAEAMDFYERALYNHILASQEPDQGMIVYLMSLKPGHFKTYSKPIDSFWCCLGTGMENHTKYADSIYFRGADGSLYVNLFIPSELAWKEKGLAIRQETRFPDEETTRLTFKAEFPVKVALRLRRPSWAGEGFAISVNGTPADAGKPGSYVTLDREWKGGDVVEVRLPMRLRAEAMPDDPSVLALLHGPIVLAGELGKEGIEGFDFTARGQADHHRVPTPEPPVFVGDPKSVIDRVEPVSGKPLAFRTKGLGRPADVSLIPFFRLHYQRYSVYWKVHTEEEWERKKIRREAEEKARRELEARLVDEVRVGEPQPETDHGLKGERTESGEHLGKRWRHALDGGWFSYRLKVLPDRPVTLSCAYWGSDAGRVFDILVDGEKVLTQKLDGKKPNEFIDVETPLPEALTKGKEQVTVRFQAHAGSTAGGVFGVRIVRRGPVDDTEDRGVTFTGAWTRWTGGGPRWGRLFYATEAGSRATAIVEGDQAVLVHKAGPDCGIARILVDGKPTEPSEIDTYSPTVEWNRATVVARGLPRGRHLVVVEVAGRRNPASTHPYVQVVHITDRAPAPPPPPWPPEKAWAWYRSIPWLAGFNYVPSTACNTTEWWQEETFDPATIDRELGWAAGLGFNTTRAFTQYLVWKHDPEGFLKRLDRFLGIASKHGISVMPVLFDDCAFGQPAQLDPFPGKQRDPLPGMILPSWTPSPGRRLGLDPEERPGLKRYVQTVIARFKDDKRVVLWDLYNEPRNTANVGSGEFLAEIFAWAREAGPSQPLSIGSWSGHPDVNHAAATLCDVTTFHCYGNRESLRKRIDGLKSTGRPLVCTEWFARPTGSRIDTDLPLLLEEKVGAYMWGLVNGRTQCQFPWWNKPGGAVDPKHGWFHDILHADGKPYREEEIEALKRIHKTTATKE